MAAFTIRDANDLYQVSSWSDGHFRVTGRGHVAALPTGPDGPEVDLHELASNLRTEGTSTPLVVRFPQILRQRVDRLNAAFRDALKANDAPAQYRGVFPVKVNQRKEVVQELARAGRRWQYGLEVGSKAELVAALTMDPNRKSLLIVNGFKDVDFLDAACRATAFKDEVIIVLDEVGELPHVIRLLQGMENPPLLGLRLKLRSKVPGKWALSGGAKAKFGLTVPEVLWAIDELREAGQLDRLRMLHFHIGSQLSNIRRVAEGVREASRIHTELCRMGVPLDRLDVGGGLAVDYDGSASSGANSCNYTVEEYASTVVATVKDACDDAGVPMPDLISESGRYVTAHHAAIIMNVMRRVPFLQEDGVVPPPSTEDPTPLQNLYEVLDDLSAKTVFEAFHDAIQHRDDIYSLFDLGHLDLPAMGRAESVQRILFQRIKRLLETEEETESEEYEHVRTLLGQKLVCNFSLFQSLPDVWGVKQQFPMMPIHRLRESPSEVATLADITCDSDGEVRRFIDPDGTRPELPVHSLRENEPYLLATFLIGAYQDSLGDYHNLFGETNEAIVNVDESGEPDVRIIDGSAVGDMLAWVRYDPGDLKRRMRGRIKRLRENGRISASDARELQQRFNSLLDSSTCLEVS